MINPEDLKPRPIIDDVTDDEIKDHFRYQIEAVKKNGSEPMRELFGLSTLGGNLEACINLSDGDVKVEIGKAQKLVFEVFWEHRVNESTFPIIIDNGLFEELFYPSSTDPQIVFQRTVAPKERENRKVEYLSWKVIDRLRDRRVNRLLTSPEAEG